MSGVELALAFLAGAVMGGALDRFVLPLLVDAWIDRLRRQVATLNASSGRNKPTFKASLAQTPGRSRRDLIEE